MDVSLLWSCLLIINFTYSLIYVKNHMHLSRMQRKSHAVLHNVAQTKSNLNRQTIEEPD